MESENKPVTSTAAGATFRVEMSGIPEAFARTAAECGVPAASVVFVMPDGNGIAAISMGNNPATSACAARMTEVCLAAVNGKIAEIVGDLREEAGRCGTAPESTRPEEGAPPVEVTEATEHGPAEDFPKLGPVESDVSDLMKENGLGFFAFAYCKADDPSNLLVRSVSADGRFTELSDTMGLMLSMAAEKLAKIISDVVADNSPGRRKVGGDA